MNLNFFLGWSASSQGGMLGSTSEAGWNGCMSFCSFTGAGIFCFSALVGFLLGSYSLPVIDVKNFFLSTWNKSAMSNWDVVNFVKIRLHNW